MDATDLLGRLADDAFTQVRTVPLFIAPHALLERHEQLDNDYLANQTGVQGLDSDGPRIAAEIAEIEAELAEYEVKFKVKALPHREWYDLLAGHPPTAKQRKEHSGLDFNPETFPGAAIQACLVDPAMTPEQVYELEHGTLIEDETGRKTRKGGLTDAQFNVLFNAVVSINQSGISSPKSMAAAALRRMSAAS